jgi:hypothetical protein
MPFSLKAFSSRRAVEGAIVLKQTWTLPGLICAINPSLPDDTASTALSLETMEKIKSQDFAKEEREVCNCALSE